MYTFLEWISCFFQPFLIIIIAMESELSLLSSKQENDTKMKIRKVATLQMNSRGVLGLTDLESNPQQSKIHKIQKKMAWITQAQQNLHQKCSKIIDSLTNDILLKDQNNIKLEEQITSLKNQLNIGKGDLQLIMEYLHKKESRRGKDKLLLDTTKDSGKEKSSSVSNSSFTKFNQSNNGGGKLRLTMGGKNRRQNSNVFLF